VPDRVFQLVMLITKTQRMFDARHRYSLLHIECVTYHFLRPRLGLPLLTQTFGGEVYDREITKRSIRKQNPNGGNAMDARYFREKAELCLRLADGLSLKNPGRFQLMDLADDFLERARELEAQKVKDGSIRHEAA
jgi:hypothetical protein